MKKKRIVITGIGVVSPIGIECKNYWRALRKGQSGIRPITIFNTEPYNVKFGGEITEFDPKRYFVRKGFNYIDRATALLLSASNLAIKDSKIIINEKSSNSIGVAIGTTFGSLQTLSKFDRESVTKGPRFVNPSLFPNTIANLPASQVSIHFNIKGFNTTVSTGMCAGLDAIDYAVKSIQFHNRRIVLTGAVEEMCEETFLGFYKLKALSGCKKGQMQVSCPFDQRRNGIVFAEGAGAMMLEVLEEAQKKDSKIYGEILSIASNFDPYRLHRYNPHGLGMVKTMSLALERANLEPRDINYICANANSTPDGDLIEGKAIQEVFGAYAKKIFVTSIKSMIGETYSAAGSLSAIAAVGSLQNNFIPPIINWESKDPKLNLNFVFNKSKELHINTIMINAFGQNGANISMIIKKFDN